MIFPHLDPLLPHERRVVQSGLTDFIHKIVASLQKRRSAGAVRISALVNYSKNLFRTLKKQTNHIYRYITTTSIISTRGAVDSVESVLQDFTDLIAFVVIIIRRCLKPGPRLAASCLPRRRTRRYTWRKWLLLLLLSLYIYIYIYIIYIYYFLNWLIDCIMSLSRCEFSIWRQRTGKHGCYVFIMYLMHD